jgi:hypothetical protein
MPSTKLGRTSIAVTNLENPQLSEVAAHGRLRDLDALVRERRDDILLCPEVVLGNEAQDQVLPRRLVHL